jgi:purine-nucleoside phosphorylase
MSMNKTPHIEVYGRGTSPKPCFCRDPLRAKVIAETYLKDVFQFNSVRNMLALPEPIKAKRYR